MNIELEEALLYYKTILKYWDMTPDDYAQAKEAAGTREKKADKYKDFI